MATSAQSRRRSRCDRGRVKRPNGPSRAAVLGLPVSLADDPLSSVALGTGMMLNDFNLLRKVALD